MDDKPWMHPQSLDSGVPQADQVSAYKYNYYEFTVNKAAQGPDPDIRIVLQQVSNDPDMYVSFADKSTSPPVGAGQWAYAAIAQDGTDTVTIHPGTTGCHANAKCYCTEWPCKVQIAVYGFGNDAEYIVTASESGSSDSVQLVDGRPTPGTVGPDQYQFYRFRAASDSITELTFTLTPTFGDPDVYVSDLIQHPTAAGKTNASLAGHFWYSEATFGLEQVRLTPPEAHSGYWYIGVHGFSYTSDV